MSEKITREELEQLGLSEEEINAMLDTQEDGGGAGLPFPIIKVNYDTDLGKAGAMGFNPIKGDDGYVESYEAIYESDYKLRLIASYYQYSKFDQATNKPSITSNIFKLKDAKKAYDLKTGKLIKPMKENDDQIKWQRVALVEISNADGSNKNIGIFYIKGAYNYELGDIIKKEGKKLPENMIELILKNKKKKNGAVTFYIPEFVSVNLLTKTDILKNIKEEAGVVKQFNDWVKSVNAGGDNKSQESSNDDGNPFADDDDEIEWN